METKEIVEALLYKMPELRVSLQNLNIITYQRPWNAAERPEFKNILKDFNNTGIISIIGIVPVTYIIDKTPRSDNTFPVLVIEGYHSYVRYWSMNYIPGEMNEKINIKDFLPEPFHRKIIYIKDYNYSPTKSSNPIGIVFSEYSKNKWTTEDPMSLPIKNSRKSGSSLILNAVVRDLLYKK